MVGQKEERERKEEKEHEAIGKAREVPQKYLPFGAFLLFPFVLAWAPFTVPGIIALLGMCAQCSSFRRRDCRPGVPDGFCWGRVIPDGDGAEGAGTQGVLSDWLRMLGATGSVLYEYCIFCCLFFSFFRNCVVAVVVLYGTGWDMGARIWEYGIFGVPRGWYCIMTMGLHVLFP